MKLSNKILIAAFSLVMILTLITMIKVKSIQMEYKQNETLGNKNWITAEFPLQEFTELKAGNHFEVNWHKGAPLVKVRIEENLKPFFKVKQEGNKISVGFDSLSSYQLNGVIIVDVYSQTLQSIHLEDFVEFSGKDTINTSEFKLELEDHCVAKVLLNTESLNLRQYDFSDLTIKGLARNVNVKLQDHSQLDADQLITSNSVLDLSDFANASIVVQSKLKVECQDHSNLEYKGDSVIAEIIQRDFSQVTKEK